MCKWQEMQFSLSYKYSKQICWKHIAFMFINHYNTTVWILARNDINFSMAVGLIGRHMPGVSNLVCNEGQRVSPYPSRQLLALFMEDSTNYFCQKQRHNFHSSSQIPF